MIILALRTVVMVLSSLSICARDSSGAGVKGNQRMNVSVPFAHSRKHLSLSPVSKETAVLVSCSAGMMLRP